MQTRIATVVLSTTYSSRVAFLGAKPQQENPISDPVEAVRKHINEPAALWHWHRDTSRTHPGP